MTTPYWTDFLPPINLRLAPGSLTQPILPNWQFGGIINNQNSAAPATEEQILEKHSYGRQIGRLLDAVSVLIAERPHGSCANKAFKELDTLKKEVDAIKKNASKRRLETLRDDLERLKATEKPEDFHALVREIAALIETYGDRRRS